MAEYAYFVANVVAIHCVNITLSSICTKLSYSNPFPVLYLTMIPSNTARKGGSFHDIFESKSKDHIFGMQQLEDSSISLQEGPTVSETNSSTTLQTSSGKRVLEDIFSRSLKTNDESDVSLFNQIYDSLPFPSTPDMFEFGILEFQEQKDVSAKGKVSAFHINSQGHTANYPEKKHRPCDHSSSTDPLLCNSAHGKNASNALIVRNVSSAGNGARQLNPFAPNSFGLLHQKQQNFLDTESNVIVHKHQNGFPRNQRKSHCGPSENGSLLVGSNQNYNTPLPCNGSLAESNSIYQSPKPVKQCTYVLPQVQSGKHEIDTESEVLCRKRETYILRTQDNACHQNIASGSLAISNVRQLKTAFSTNTVELHQCSEQNSFGTERDITSYELETNENRTKSFLQSPTTNPRVVSSAHGFQGSSPCNIYLVPHQDQRQSVAHTHREINSHFQETKLQWNRTGSCSHPSAHNPLPSKNGHLFNSPLPLVNPVASYQYLNLVDKTTKVTETGTRSISENFKSFHILPKNISRERNTTHQADNALKSSDESSLILSLLNRYEPTELRLQESEESLRPNFSVRHNVHLQSSNPIGNIANARDVPSGVLTLPPSSLEKNNSEVQDASASFFCDICLTVFANKKNMQVHSYKAHTVNKEICDICQVGFTNRSFMMAHKRMSHRQNMTNGKGIFPIRVNEKPQKKFFCHLCKRDFKWNVNLNRHIDLKHLKKRNFACSICGKKFGTKQNREIHMLKHKTQS